MSFFFLSPGAFTNFLLCGQSGSRLRLEGAAVGLVCLPWKRVYPELEPTRDWGMSQKLIRKKVKS